MHLTLCRIIYLLLWLLCSYGYTDSKINVAFVIDDTGSMQDDIKQIKDKTQVIFNTVMKHNNSVVEEFILITFGDYGISAPDDIHDDFSRTPIKVRTTTRDPNIFYNALDQINITKGVGGDCPKLALTGIKKAIAISKPNSYIYVFTDASAKDYTLEDEVKSLALNKFIQISFILTGNCKEQFDDANDVFKRLATATSGEVFVLKKINVNKIINYITNSVQDQKSTLLSKGIIPGHKNYIITVDDDMMYILISTSITNEESGIKLEVVDPHGNIVHTIDVAKTRSIKVVKILEPEVGEYQVNTYAPWTIFGNMIIGGIVIRASINIDFQYHFLNTTPSLTRTPPIAGEILYLEIKVEVPRQVHLKLVKVVFIDTDDSKILEITITPETRQKDNIYIVGPFQLPDKLFKIAILCIDQNTGGKVKRIGRTYVKPNHVSPKIDKWKSDIEVQKGSPVILSCRILKGSPVPTISWEFKKHDSNHFERLPRETEQEMYISSVGLDTVGVYKCIASNEAGSDFHEIKLKVQYSPKIYKPYDSITVIKGSKAVILCRTSNLIPHPNMNWEYKRSGSHLFERLWKTDQEIVIDSVDLDKAGVYKCEASNEFGKDSHEVTLNVQNSASVVSIELPKTIKTGDEVVLMCKITGEPAPNMDWLKDGTPIESHAKYETNNNSLRSMPDLSDSWRYNCIATNIYVSSSNTVTMGVHDYPKISKTHNSITVMKGSIAVISCRTINLLPTTNMTWEFKRSGSPIFERLSETDQEIHINAAALDNAGVYKCQASNEVGSDSHEITLTVQYAPTVSIDQPNITKTGTEVILTCKITGEPTPNVKWFRDGISIDVYEKYVFSENNSVRFVADLDDAGIYTCTAKNALGSDSKRVKFEVHEPVQIENPGKTEFNIVENDKVVRLPCKATGHPKPTVTWMKDDVPLIIGETNYIQESDNTLVHQYPDLCSTGTYTCMARNNVTSFSQAYKLNVLKYPIPSEPMETFYLEKEISYDVRCDIPNSESEDIRWFTNERQIQTDPILVITHASEKDSGIYSCRANFDLGSESYHIKILVGTSPKFVNDTYNKNVLFGQGLKQYLDCSVTGEPTPKIKWWQNEILLPETSMIYELQMNISDIGIWRCEAENPLGSILRTYFISPYFTSI